jgi:tetratricopeptide (TPR) repeat protein
MLLEDVLPKVLNNTWDIKAALARRNWQRRLEKLDEEAYYELIRFRRDPLHPQDLDADSVLATIKEIVQKEPDLKYAPMIAFYTFVALLKTDPRKACEYGKVAMVTPTYTEPAWSQIRGAVKLYADKLDLPAEIYQLGAEAYQAEIDHVGLPENVDLYKFYNNMAILYWRANDTLKAIDAQQKAIADLKNRKNYSSVTLAEYESKLQQYKSK